jgi:hypothetical protein
MFQGFYVSFLADVALLNCWHPWEMIYGDLWRSFPYGRSFGWCSTSLNWVGIINLCHMVGPSCPSPMQPMALPPCQWQIANITICIDSTHSRENMWETSHETIFGVCALLVFSCRWWVVALGPDEAHAAGMGPNLGWQKLQSVPAGVKLGFPRLIF